METKEINLEDKIENYLITQGGYIKGDEIGYDSLKGYKSNKLLDRSKLGLKGEENCQNSKDCFRGHTCVINHCNPCHYEFCEYDVYQP